MTLNQIYRGPHLRCVLQSPRTVIVGDNPPRMTAEQVIVEVKHKTSIKPTWDSNLSIIRLKALWMRFPKMSLISESQQIFQHPMLEGTYSLRREYFDGGSRDRYPPSKGGNTSSTHHPLSDWG